MFISAYFQAVSSRREGRRRKMHVGHRLSCCNEESIKVLVLQSGVGGDQLYVCNWHTKLREVLRCKPWSHLYTARGAQLKATCYAAQWINIIGLSDPRINGPSDYRPTISLASKVLSSCGCHLATVVNLLCICNRYTDKQTAVEPIIWPATGRTT